MKIAICDDEKKICVFIKDKLIAYSVANNVDIHIQTFENGEKLLEEFPEDIDALFLDMDMPGRNGLKIAEEIRKRGSNVIIIFLTAYSEFVFESFKVDTFRYLLKPLKEKDFLDTMEALKNRLYEPEECLNLQFQSESYNIRYADIIYIEVMSHKIWIHCKNDTFRWRGTLANLTQKLDGKGFYRVHRSYLINMNKIQKYNSQTVWLENGHEVPISKNQLNGFKEEYIKFWSKIL